MKTENFFFREKLGLLLIATTFQIKNWIAMVTVPCLFQFSQITLRESKFKTPLRQQTIAQNMSSFYIQNINAYPLCAIRQTKHIFVHSFHLEESKSGIIRVIGHIPTFLQNRGEHKNRNPMVSISRCLHFYFHPCFNLLNVYTQNLLLPCLSYLY